jgi:pyruvate dehydrogenase E2 component (dihydrolipoamide acetyltransferase)
LPLIAQEIPKIGLVMDTVTVTRWLKSVGDAVNAGDVLLEVESEKSVVEIEAAATGRLAQILVQADQSATVGDKVAWIDSADEQRPPVMDESGQKIATSSARSSAGHPSAPPATRESSAADRILSTPAARRVAVERGLDLRDMAGTGPGGRIQLKDVEGAAGPRASSSSGSPQPLSAMRRALVRAMTLSNATVPQFTVSRSVDWTVLDEVRNEVSTKIPSASPKLSINDFLLQAAARALIEFPDLNATFAGDSEGDGRIVPAIGAHIGLVVATDNGLLVPVIHDVERLGLSDIASRRAACVERSMKGRLNSDELVGATFSISNLGVQGPDRFTAIINPPQSAILAVGRKRDGVTVEQGVIMVRPTSDLTLTVDHRVADGRLAAQFLGRLVAILEDRVWRT